MKQQAGTAISKYWVEIVFLGYILIGIFTALAVALFRSWQSSPIILPINIALAMPAIRNVQQFSGDSDAADRRIF